MYLVVPRLLLKNKYLLTGLMVIFLFGITAVLSTITGIYILDNLKDYLLPGTQYVSYYRINNNSIFLSLLAGLRGGITVGGIAAAIKLMKYLYLKEQRNMQLQSENTQAQLELLKAQVNPHFLFNTLNNIYSHTQNTSAIASKLVLGLSGMLRYMLYDGNHPLVSLSDEVKLLQDYITCETIRYGNKLDVNFDVPANTNDYRIAPLLLLPFVENSFKHGASQVLDHPWLSLTISFTGNKMHFKLVNGKAEHYDNPHAYGGLGIKNVRSRLELLYHGKHQLKVQDEDEVFVVDLAIELEWNKKDLRPIVTTAKEIVYE